MILNMESIENSIDLSKQTLIRIKVQFDKVDYIKANPLHSSQQEIEQDIDNSIFQYKVIVDDLFIQKLLSMSTTVEVLEPIWVRNELLLKAKEIQKMYEQSQSPKSSIILNGIKYELNSNGSAAVAAVAVRSFFLRENSLDIPTRIGYSDFVFDVKYSYGSSLKGLNIESISFGNKFESLGGGVLESCTQLRNIHLPQSLLTIYHDAFRNCKQLEKIYIPKNVKEIDTGIFSGCENLKSVIVDEDNKYFDSRENCNAIIETSFDKLITGCSTSIIPSSVRVIDKYAFTNSSISSIEIPNSVDKVELRAFSDCSQLKSVMLDAKSIGHSAFANCINLQELVIGPNVSIIDCHAFEGCCNLESVILGDNVATLREHAFLCCTKLTNITLSKSLNYITINALDGCENLKVINVPNITYNRLTKEFIKKYLEKIVII